MSIPEVRVHWLGEKINALLMPPQINDDKTIRCPLRSFDGKDWIFLPTSKICSICREELDGEKVVHHASEEHFLTHAFHLRCVQNKTKDNQCPDCLQNLDKTLLKTFSIGNEMLIYHTEAGYQNVSEDFFCKSCAKSSR